MTESEWLVCIDPEQLLKPLTNQPNWMRLQVLAVACLRRIWHLIPTGACREAAEVAESWANRSASGEEINAASDWAAGALAVFFDDGGTHPATRVEYHATHAVYVFHQFPGHERMVIGVAHDTRWALGRQAWHAIAQDGAEATYGPAREAQEAAMREEASRQCDLIRDIFPFRPVALDPRWRTPAVAALAKTIHDERRFADIPILGDALEEADCTNADLLAHCREPREHVRGCWAVDLLLGRDQSSCS